MKLRDLSIEHLDIPFTVSFRHSSAVRATTESVLVTAVTDNGIQGVGEGCPRQYVTGETLETTYDFFSAHHRDFLSICTLDDLKIWVDNHRTEIDINPAAFCAVELALLGALAKEKCQSVEALLALPELSGEFQYTGVLGASNPESFQAQFDQYRNLGFTDFKVKISGDAAIDKANIVVIKECGCDNIRLRLDANNLWSNWSKAATYIKVLDYPFFGLEEPLKVNEYDGCRKIFEELEVPIILDESFTREADFRNIQSNPETWIINIRISKMGGILRSLIVAERSKELDIPIILGAHVGETSILTRAALTVANKYHSILLAQEGAFGTYLLEHDVVKSPIMFGNGGLLTAEQI